jgi:tetratricopeptide (TPR) repeat protein
MNEKPTLMEGAPTIEELQAAFEADPKNPQAAGRLGWELYGLRHFKAASEILEAARKLAPDDPELAYVQGLTLKNLMENEAARKAFAAAIKNASRLSNPLRSAMLQRLSQAQLNYLEGGAWNMDQTTQ